jgi:acyl-CoA thioesterase-2
MFDLQAHGPDTYVGTGPRYPWGGLYGGQIVAQALRAAARAVDPDVEPHSIRAYFIRPGDHTEPVRYEVDRIRNGRSFTTRRVVARQAIGAILNAECSFQRPESSLSIQTIAAPIIPDHAGLPEDSFSTHFDRCFVPSRDVGGDGRDGIGRVVAWMRATDDLDGVDDNDVPFLQQCWLTYLSDDLATDAVRAAPATTSEHPPDMNGVSLDHTVWFHRPIRADRWHIHDVSCHHFAGARGLAVGHVFAAAGEHVATYAQEVLLRPHKPPIA